MTRQFFLTIIVSILLASAIASNTAKPVVIGMGILSFFVISASTPRREPKKEEKS